jgi:uncharacterized FlaG/YvyC family protein
MSDQIIALNAERVTVPAFPRGKAVAQAMGSRVASQADQPQGVRKSSVRLVHSEELGRPVVHILDRETGEIIYQIPPEELQKLSTFLDEFKGSVVDKLA